jgi:hypothetical protein
VPSTSPTNPLGAPGRLADHVALTALGDGVYRRQADRTWWGHGSLFGGYTLALAVEAMALEAGPDRHLRAATMHFLRPFLDGDVRVAVTTERAGRTVTSLSARLTSDDRLCGLVLATYAVERDASPFEGAPAPAVAPVREGEQPSDPAAGIPTQGHFRFWPRFESGHDGDVAVTGGWVRPSEPEPWTAGMLLAIGDLWLPAIYGHLVRASVAMSSDFTGHVRVSSPEDVLDPGAPVLARLRTRRSAHGFVDEDTDIWSPSGELVASTRQLRFIGDVPTG